MLDLLGYFALPIAQVNFGLALASYLGLLQVLGALGYFALSVSQVVVASRSRRNDDLVIRIIQLIFAPLLLLLSGVILFFNGWRLDPFLQFQQIFTSILIVYLVFIDLRKPNRPT